MNIWMQMGFQDSVSPVLYSLDKFHSKAMILIVLIMMYVFSGLMSVKTAYPVLPIMSAHSLEAAWTVFPAVVLIMLALPSLRLLYMIDEQMSPTITMKVIGHQWYWTYDYGHFEFDSYMKDTQELSVGHPRLLEVDNRLILPLGLELRALITSADVLHSWSLPSLGVKVDAIPGRLNQASIMSFMPGVYYGSCTEICGANHSFMPIAVEFINQESWIKWIENKVF